MIVMGKYTEKTLFQCKNFHLNSHMELSKMSQQLALLHWYVHILTIKQVLKQTLIVSLLLQDS